MDKNNNIGKYDNGNAIFYHLKNNKMNKLEQGIHDYLQKNHNIFTEVCFPFQKCKKKKYDLFLPDKKIVIEVDGNLYHAIGEQIIKDIKYTKMLNNNGITIIRVKESYIRNNRGVFYDDKLLKLYNISNKKYKKSKYILLGEYDKFIKNINPKMYILKTVLNTIAFIVTGAINTVNNLHKK